MILNNHLSIHKKNQMFGKMPWASEMHQPGKLAVNGASVLHVFLANAATIAENHMVITEFFFFFLLLMEKYKGSAGPFSIWKYFSIHVAIVQKHSTFIWK